MRWLVFALVAVTIAGVTWWSASHRSAVAPAPDSAANVQPTDIAARVPHGAAPQASVDPRSALVARREANQAEAEKSAALGRSRLVAQFQSEKIDGAWAIARQQSLVQSSISPQITDLKVEPRNMRSECRSATCRITADFANRSAADDWVTLFLTNPGTNLSRAGYKVLPNPDGTVSVEIYASAR